MKIAVCLYGHLRTYEHCYKALRENLLDRYDCDVFMHTWSTIDHTTSVSWHGGEMANNVSTIDRKDEIIQKYGLKDIIIEEQEKKEKEYGYYYFDIPKPRPVWSFHCLWHAIESVNRLRENYQKEHNITYDYVVFTRPDVLFKEPFEIDKYIGDLEKDVLAKSYFSYTSYCNNTTRINDLRHTGGNDIFFFAAPEIISNIIVHKKDILSHIKDGVTLTRTPESYVFELTQKLGYTNWFICFRPGKNVDILREKDIQKLTPEKKEPVKISRYQKHKEKLKTYLKGAIKIPEEIVSVLWYWLKNK